MKRLLIASIVIAMAAPTFAQTRTQPQTRTTDPDATITESQKGGPCIERICAGRWWSANCHEASYAKRRRGAHTCASPLNLSFPVAQSLGLQSKEGDPRRKWRGCFRAARVGACHLLQMVDGVELL